jgi:hypothetical protein
MSTVTHRFGYAIVRAGVYMTDPLNILYVYGSLEKAREAITRFAYSSDFTPVASAAPSDLREPDDTIPEWWKGYHLFEGYYPVGRVYIERVKMDD